MHGKKLAHYQELACKKGDLVRKFWDIFPLCNHVVMILALIEYYKYVMGFG
jgi:hypothetical protein